MNIRKVKILIRYARMYHRRTLMRLHYVSNCKLFGGFVYRARFATGSTDKPTRVDV